MFICKFQLEIFLFLIVGVMVEVVYLRYLFKDEAQKVVYFQLITDGYIPSTVSLMFNKENLSTYEDDAELLDSEIRSVVYHESYD